MNITLWGIRGSIPTFNPQTVQYGGHTSCVEVEEDGHLLILDAGSGMQNLHQSPHIGNKRIDILLTHLHIDHIQGLGFFKPLFDPDREVHIWGPATLSQNLRARLGRYFSPPLFPVYFRNLVCQLFIHEIDNSSFTIGSFSIRSEFIIHPGPTVAYRISTKRGSFAYFPDHEPALGCLGELEKDPKWLSGSNLAMGADILLHDAQYTRAEYELKRGWGHCAMEDTVRYGASNHVNRLYLMHHDPSHTDFQLDEMYAQVKTASGRNMQIYMAVEGATLTI